MFPHQSLVKPTHIQLWFSSAGRREVWFTSLCQCYGRHYTKVCVCVCVQNPWCSQELGVFVHGSSFLKSLTPLLRSQLDLLIRGTLAHTHTHTLKIEKRERFAVFIPEKFFQSVKSQGFQKTVGTSGVLHMTACAGIYYACKACVPVWLGVYVCQHLCMCRERKRRGGMKLIISFWGGWQWLIPHSHNVFVCMCVKIWTKLRGLLWSCFRKIKFTVHSFNLSFWVQIQQRLGLVEIIIAVEVWMSPHTRFLGVFFFFQLLDEARVNNVVSLSDVLSLEAVL